MTGPGRALLTLALALLAGCSAGDPAETEVRSRFMEFESALRAADGEALCNLLTRESLPAIEQVRPAAAGARERLVVEAVQRRDPTRYDVAVREADSANDAGIFVMLRENGAWRVDLVESAVATHGVEKGPVTIEPSGLTPGQIDEIRANRATGLK